MHSSKLKKRCLQEIKIKVKSEIYIYIYIICAFSSLLIHRTIFEPCKINHCLTNLDHILTPADENVDVTKYALRV